MSVTRRTLATTSSIVLPACATSLLPDSTLSTESPISDLISFAAAAERCARLRTSVATTANPRPCSPARAASTAAFSARILVWNAMPSMTPMMSTIFFADSLICSIVCTTSDTTLPPRCATSDALIASWLAWPAFSAFWRTVEVSSSIDDAVSSSEDACCSVRDDRSRLPAAICPEAVAMVSVPLRTFRTMSASFSRIVFIANSRLLLSPGWVSICTSRSPDAMRDATSAAVVGSPPSCCVRPRVMNHAASRPDSTAMTPSVIIRRCALS